MKNIIVTREPPIIFLAVLLLTASLFSVVFWPAKEVHAEFLANSIEDDGGGSNPATATLSANPTTITLGQSSTLSWSSTNATSCTGTNFNTGNATSGSVAVSPTATTQYSLSCTGSGGTANANRTITVTAPNLRISSDPTPTTATAGQSRTYSATVQNNGTASAGSSTTRFQRATSSGGANTTTVANVSTGSIAAGGTQTVSASYTHPSAGTFWIRACADITNVVTESNENDNCSAWTAVTVSNPPISASCSVSPTSIFTGQSATWSASASGGSGSYTYSWSGTDSLTGSTANVSKLYSTTGTKNGSVTVSSPGSPNVTVSCSNSVVVSNHPAATATLSANPTTITLGQSSTLSWSSTNATSCTGTNFNTGNATSGSVAVSPTATTQYSLSCTGSGGTANTNRTITVSNPPLTASCSANPTSIFTGQGATWTASASGGTGSYTYNWRGHSWAAPEDRLSGSTMQVSKIYTTIGNKWGIVDITSGSQQQTAECWNYVSVAGRPDMVTGSVSPTTATAGTSTTFSVTVSNVGSANAGSSTTRFQRATSSGGANTTNIGDISTASIAAGSSRVVSAAHTLPSAGTWYIRACADINNNIAESNEGNNCGAWTAVSAGAACIQNGGVVETVFVDPFGTCNAPMDLRLIDEPRCCSGAAVYGGAYGCNVTCVAPSITLPPPTASLTASPTTITLGQSSTLTWSSTYASSCTGTGFNTGGATSGSVAVSPTATTQYSLSCTGSGGTANTNRTITVTAPNLRISSGPTPTTATAGQARTYSATVQNNGTASAGSSTTRFQRATSSGGANTTTVANVSTGSIVAGGTQTVSASYTHPSAGTFWIRACADINNNVAESNESWADNCSAWTAVTVSNPPITASCSVSPTSIFTGQGATWSASASGGSGSYTYSWSGTDSLSGSTANVSKLYTTTGTKTGSVTVSSPGSPNVTVSCSNSVSVAGRPDLATGSVSPTNATALQSVTFSATVSNIGTASTGSSFNNTFFIDNDSNHATIFDSRTVSTSALGAGSNRNVSTSFTFPSAGTWYVRACADQNASGQGSITESNENNNCGQWTVINVMPFPTPTATLTATPSTIDNGQSSLLSWSSSNTNTCTGNFSTGNATSGSLTVSPTATITYTLTCAGPGGSVQSSRQITVIQRPDLIINPNQVNMPSSIVLEVEPEQAGEGAQAALSATVRNNGTGSTGTSFTNTFFINTTPSHNAGQSTQSRSMNALNAGATRLFDASHTFPSSGTYYARACADQSANGQGTIIESNENNNCTPWRSINVSITVLPPRGNISISASPSVVVPLTSAQLTWSVENMQIGSCSVTGPSLNRQNLNNSQNASGAITTPAITSSSTYTLRCTDLRGDIQTDTTTVGPVPEFEEF